MAFGCKAIYRQHYDDKHQVAYEYVGQSLEGLMLKLDTLIRHALVLNRQLDWYVLSTLFMEIPYLWMVSPHKGTVMRE